MLLHRFKIYRNMLVYTLIRKSKQNYYNKYFSENVKNLRQVWKRILNILQIKNKTSSTPTCILDNGISMTDPCEVADV